MNKIKYFKILTKKNIGLFIFVILFPLSLVLLSAEGGMEQTGQYVMYSFLIWVSNPSYQFCNFVKNK